MNLEKLMKVLSSEEVREADQHLRDLGYSFLQLKTIDNIVVINYAGEHGSVVFEIEDKIKFNANCYGMKADWEEYTLDKLIRAVLF